MNPPPLSRLNAEQSSDLTPAQPPLREVPVPTTPSQLSRPTPKPRRAIIDRGTPRSSKLGQEVYSASTDEAAKDRDEDDSAMDVDLDDK